jgi:hypothetical protein
MPELPNFGQERNPQGQIRNPQGQQQEQLQFNLQICDDTWERLLCALERLEYVTEYKANYDIPRPVATRLDEHKDKGDIQESQVEVETEVQLQIQSFKYIVKTVQSETETWLLQDFICWLSGRERKTMGGEPLPLGLVDDYAVPVLQCILAEPFKLPEISKLLYKPPTQKDVLNAATQLGVGQMKTDDIQKRFEDDPSQQATQHLHERGVLQDGMERLQAIAQKLNQSAWFNRFMSEKRWQTR